MTHTKAQRLAPTRLCLTALPAHRPGPAQRPPRYPSPAPDVHRHGTAGPAFRRRAAGGHQPRSAARQQEAPPSRHGPTADCSDGQTAKCGAPTTRGGGHRAEAGRAPRRPSASYWLLEGLGAGRRAVSSKRIGSPPGGFVSIPLCEGSAAPPGGVRVGTAAGKGHAGRRECPWLHPDPEHTAAAVF